MWRLERKLFRLEWLPCLALVLCLSGCGGDGDDDDPPPPEPVQSMVWDQTDWDGATWQ